MKLLKLIKQIILEKKEDTYEYGCAMLYFNFPEINKIHDVINVDDLYEEEGDRTYGLENEPHTTLLFGLHQEVTLKEIKEILNKFTFETCLINNVSLFENEKYDVLKFDVKGKNLHNCNNLLKNLPHTNNFPNYHPHLTIGYLKPGIGKKYTNMLKEYEFELQPQYAVYSSPDGTKTKIKINK
jgi:2'-5' RNA ligase